jgi:Kef-type K+ transport system membrane component KefB
MSGLAGPIIDFGLLIIIAMLLGGVALFLRQPLILAYIVAGVLLGSQGFGLIHDEQYLYEISSELGIAMLLFVVGLELSIKKMMEVKRVVTFGVLAQAILLVIVGMFAGYALGFNFIESIYIGLVIAFASTLLIVKLLGEKRQVDTLPGRIMIGSLVFEDILVIITISVLGILAGAEPTGFVLWMISLPGLNLVPYIQNIALLVGAILLLVSAYLINRYVARYLFRFFSHSAEMLFVSSLGFLFIVAFLAGELGFSVAIGAFIAGVIVANTEYYLDVLGKVKTLATFFALLFFATLGFKVTFENFTSLLIPVISITLIVVIIKPIIVGSMVRLFGYDKRTSIFVGLHMSQISEFGLILVAFGIKFGHVSDRLLTITILVLLLSFTISSYYATYSQSIIVWLQRRFRSLSSPEDIKQDVAIQHAKAVVYGVQNLDEQFVAQVLSAHPTALFIDPDPEGLDYLRSKDIPTLSGSLSNDELLEKVEVAHLDVLISTISDYEENLLICEHVRKHNANAVLIFSVGRTQEAISLYEHGASYVHVASFMDDAAIQNLLANADHEQLAESRKKHVARLTQIISRSHGAVDIEQFMSSLADQHLKPVQRAFKKTSKHFEEVDKFVKNIGKKK